MEGRLARAEEEDAIASSDIVIKSPFFLIITVEKLSILWCHGLYGLSPVAKITYFTFPISPRGRGQKLAFSSDLTL